MSETPGQIAVALFGHQFMGRTHSNAHLKVAKFFTDLPLEPVMHTVMADDTLENIQKFARRWGWQNAKQAQDSREVYENPEIGLIDIGTPNWVHEEQAICALENGKHVLCEKPMANTLESARRMLAAAKKAKKCQTAVSFTYRRCPAVALARELVQSGRLGRLYHVRAVYLQDWGGPSTPLLWRFQKKFAGSGAHGDLNAHIVDLARFITGDEITEVSGAIAETFIKERTLSGTGPKGQAKMGKSDVDDCVLFLARFGRGTVASFEATRLAAGRQNYNGIEINGELGSVQFQFEDMNNLYFYDATLDGKTAGWRRIMCTKAGAHPYAGNWWPDAHLIGYEHTFINQLADLLRVIGGQPPVVPLADFADAYQTQRVLEAALLSAKERCAVKLSEVK